MTRPIERRSSASRFWRWLSTPFDVPDWLERPLRLALERLHFRLFRTIAAVGILCWLALECFGPVRPEAISSGTYDWMQKHRLWASAPDPRILIVDIDERSLAGMSAEFGRWPWPRDTLASVLSWSEGQGAAAVVFDILLSDPDRLHPGGDVSLSTAVEASSRTLFPVLRLPAQNDGASQLRLSDVPGLVASSEPGVAPTVALVLPFMKSVLDAGRLGTNNAHLDGDGVLRRHALTEDVQGWHLASLPWRTASLIGSAPWVDNQERLIAWRKAGSSYPRASFSDAWSCAERLRTEPCPTFSNRIVIIGASAPSLHDVRTSPLRANHDGVDILATLVDNALHRRVIYEMTNGWKFAIALLTLCVAYFLTEVPSIGTSKALVGLPLSLLFLSYLSLQSEYLFLDLSLPAEGALLLLTMVKLYDTTRRRVYAQNDEPDTTAYALYVSAPQERAEHLERAVFDEAASSRLRVSGGSQIGHGSPVPSYWVLWGFREANAARDAGARLLNLLSAASTRVFPVSRDAASSLSGCLAQG